MTAKYDLSINQGANFNIFVQYLDSSDNPVNLASYTAALQIRRAKETSYPILYATTNGVTVGFTGGSGVTGGVSGIGGISLNTNYDGSALTGGIYIKVGPSSTAYFPVGRHLYDLDLIIGTTYTNRLLEGRADVTGETTR